ncbi:MAG TPA: sugar ABC transporter permease [Chloroflexota bacterium]|nr:sugar ABC transporter permease [Chloroflexota bacterium]
MQTIRPLGLTRSERHNILVGLAFCAPFLLGFLGFTLYPMAASFYYSFTHFDGLNPPRWIGLNNYNFLFTQDDEFKQALSNTAYMVVAGVPAQLLAAFVTALLLNVKIRGMAIYRSFYLLPAFLPIVPVAYLWQFMFNSENGIVNLALGAVGLPQPGWFIDPNWSKPGLVLLFMWTIGTTTIIYLAALQDVPEHLYEAAELDGAGALRRMWHVTVPMISPATLFNLITIMIATFQLFGIAFVVSNSGSYDVGEPQGSLNFYLLYLWKTAFSYLRFGYASAMAWILFLIIMFFTLILLYGSRRWVYYEGEAR